jgi:hypothetical protein
MTRAAARRLARHLRRLGYAVRVRSAALPRSGRTYAVERLLTRSTSIVERSRGRS